jgi:hypothetical protein
LEGCEFGNGHKGERMIRFESSQTILGGHKVNKQDSREARSGSFVRKTGGDEEILSPLPLFGNCPEIHTSVPPDLPEIGEAEIQAKQLFSHPSLPSDSW